MTRTRYFSSAPLEALPPLPATNTSSTRTILLAQTSNSPLAVDVELMRRPAVAVDQPSGAVVTLHRAAHTFLQAQSSELHQLLDMIRVRLSIQTLSLALPPKWAQFAAVDGESYGSPTSKPKDERQ